MAKITAQAEANTDPGRASALVEEAAEIVRHAGEPDDHKAVTLAGMAVLVAGAVRGQAAHLADQAQNSAGAIDDEDLRPVVQACVRAR